jgi:dephospho-CoA kinase
MKKKLKIGITGGIGSGKSLVSNFIKENGYTVLLSDLIAKDLMQNDDKIKKQIIKSFGDQSYIEGKLNTKYLAENVFVKKENVEKINSIVHPPTLNRIEKESNRILQKDNLVFVESALIYEAKFQKMFDHVILIYSERDLRIKRAMDRDKISNDEVEKRMQFQLPDEDKKERASFVIENNSTIEELKVRVKFILNLLTSLTS